MPGRSAAPAYRWIAVLPPLALLVGAPLANRVHLLVFGVPFLLAWIVACVVLTSGVMGLLLALDRRGGEPAAPVAPAPGREID